MAHKLKRVLHFKIKSLTFTYKNKYFYSDAKTHPQRSICAHSAPVSLSLACQFVSIGNLPGSTVCTNHNMTPFSSTCHYSDASIIRDEELNSKSAWSHALPLFNKCPAAVARLL